MYYERRREPETRELKPDSSVRAPTQSVVPLIQDEEPAVEELVEDEPVADVRDGWSVEETTAGSLGAELVEDENEEERSGALPSQPERDHCSAEGSTRHSGRERKTTDSTVATDDDLSLLRH